MEMGLLDEVLNVKKEAANNRPVRVTPSQKNSEKTHSSTNRTPITLSNVSIFGSLKKGTTPATIPKTTVSTNLYDVKKKSATTKGRLPEKTKEKRNWFRVSPRKDPEIKPSSTSSVNVVGGNSQKNVLDGFKKKPKGIFVQNNITYRRGQNTKLDGQNIDNLSRTSSITNLDADNKTSKGAKPKKSASRDRLDKIGDKKNDKKNAPKNNNKLETEDIPYPSIESAQEEELLELKRQLQDMAQEKTNLALQLGEQKGQLQSLQKEILKLKAYQDESNRELEHLTEENTALRNRLRDVAHSPLSDNEKQQLLFESHRQHSSAPASIATNLLDEGTGGDNTTCTTPDWDKHSSSNVSEVSVACLQDKINQMQETHYSTNEELQATLQELTDLQRQLTELQQENERLTDEKNLMFDSLCRQTERLNDSRSEVESLKQLLYQEKDDASQLESAAEREQKLVALLKSAQEERESLLVKLEQLNSELQEARTAIIEKDDRIMQLSERVKTLEYTLDAKHAEHKLLDQDLAQARDQCSGKQIEINRLTDLLENARTKISELEQDRALSDKSELDEMLDNARKEKDTLESEVAHLKKQLALSKNEIEKLKEQVSILQEECKVTRNNARTTQSDLEYKCEKLLKEKNDLNGQIQEFQEALNELQVQSQCQLEDKRQLSAVLSETQRNLSEAERKNLSLENEVDELKKLRAEENAEWEKFQSDLLTSVRVANDFKTEAQQQLQRMILENKSFRDRERQLQAEIEKLKGPTQVSRASSVNLYNSEPSNMDFLIKRPKQKGITKKQSGTYEYEEKIKAKESTLEKIEKRQRKKVEFSTVGRNKLNEPHKNKTLPIPKKNNPAVVKRSNRTLLANKRYKSLSVEEGHLLDSLKRRYEEIEKLPQNKRTEMDNSIVRLKLIYDDENLKYKPVALKPKDQLAISKPLLESVFHNPKLKNIAMNPEIKSAEEMESYLSRNSLFEKQEEPRKLTKQLSVGDNINSDFKKKLMMTRSYSYGDFPYYSEPSEAEIPLYRSVIAEDLTREPSLVLRRTSTILPSDSVSNFRGSLISINNKPLSPKKSIRVSFSNLDKIVATIPPGTPERQLTKEQKFAVKLKKALDSAERKNTLKRKRRSKKPQVSLPTKESVWRNENLRKILRNKDFLQVPVKENGSHLEKTSDHVKHSHRLTRSYEDISFSFDKIPFEYETQVTNEQSSTTSSSDTLSNAEFDLDTQTVRPCTVETYADVTAVDAGDYMEIYPEQSINFKTGADLEKLINKTKVLAQNDTLKKEDLRDIDTIDYDYIESYSEAPIKFDNPDKRELANTDLRQNYLWNNEEADSKYLLLEQAKITQSLPNISEKLAEVNDDLLYNETLDKSSRKTQLKTEVAFETDPIQNDLLYAQPTETDNKHFMSFESPSSPLRNYKDPNMETDSLSVQTEMYFTSEDTPTPTKQTLARYKSLNAKFEELHQLIHDDDDVPLRKLNSPINNKQCGDKINSTSDQTDAISDERRQFKSYSLPNKELNISEPFCSSNSIEPENGEKNSSIVCRGKRDVETGEVVKGICPSKLQNKRHSQPKENQAYHYTNILRENKYGVTTPLSLRISYRDCVNEIKNKLEDENENVEEADAKKNEDDDEYDTSLKDEMKESVNDSYKETHDLQNKIDSEMEEIFEKYLNMPISKVLSRSQINNDDDGNDIKNDNKESKTAEEIDDLPKNIDCSTAFETNPTADLSLTFKETHQSILEETTVDGNIEIPSQIRSDFSISTQSEIKDLDDFDEYEECSSHEMPLKEQWEKMTVEDQNVADNDTSNDENQDTNTQLQCMAGSEFGTSKFDNNATNNTNNTLEVKNSAILTSFSSSSNIFQQSVSGSTDRAANFAAKMIFGNTSTVEKTNSSSYSIIEEQNPHESTLSQTNTITKSIDENLTNYIGSNRIVYTENAEIVSERMDLKEDKESFKSNDVATVDYLKKELDVDITTQPSVTSTSLYMNQKPSKVVDNYLPISQENARPPLETKNIRNNNSDISLSPKAEKYDLENFSSVTDCNLATSNIREIPEEIKVLHSNQGNNDASEPENSKINESVQIRDKLPTSPNQSNEVSDEDLLIQQLTFSVFQKKERKKRSNKNPLTAFGLHDSGTSAEPSKYGSNTSSSLNSTQPQQTESKATEITTTNSSQPIKVEDIYSVETAKYDSDTSITSNMTQHQIDSHITETTRTNRSIPITVTDVDIGLDISVPKESIQVEVVPRRRNIISHPVDSLVKEQQETESNTGIITTNSSRPVQVEETYSVETAKYGSNTSITSNMTQQQVESTLTATTRTIRGIPIRVTDVDRGLDMSVPEESILVEVAPRRRNIISHPVESLVKETANSLTGNDLHHGKAQAEPSKYGSDNSSSLNSTQQQETESNSEIIATNSSLPIKMEDTYTVGIAKYGSDTSFTSNMTQKETESNITRTKKSFTPSMTDTDIGLGTSVAEESKHVEIVPVVKETENGKALAEPAKYDSNTSSILNLTQQRQIKSTDTAEIDRNVSISFKDSPTASHRLAEEDSIQVEVIRRRRRNILPVPLKPEDDKIGSFSPRASRTIVEDTFSKRLSFPTFDRKLLSTTRKVKSFAQHFEKLSADQKKQSNSFSKEIKIDYKKDRPVQLIERKPLPLPRKMNQVAKDIDSDNVKIDTTDEINMTDCYENFSEHVSNLNMSDNINLNKDDLETVPKVVSEDYKKEVKEDIKSNSVGGRLIDIGRSEKRAGGSSERDEQSNLNMMAEVSPSVIAVAGKFESLNLTASSVNSIEEVDTDSDLNLFTIDSSNFEDSYLNLFKSPEDTFYENMTKKRNLTGFINVVCVEEQSDSESDEPSARYEKIENILDCGSKPRIIDFVPLDDDDTKPVFDKNSEGVEPAKASSNSEDSTNSVTSSPIHRLEETPGLKNTNTDPGSFKSARSFFEQLELNNKINVEDNKNIPPEK